MSTTPCRRDVRRVDGSLAGAWLPLADVAVVLAVVLAVGPDRPSTVALVDGLAPELASGFPALAQ